jgi:1,4-dihydroxy-6-naphthoate synthase
MIPLSLGMSPCPNDTFMFHALLHGLIDCGNLAFTPSIHDIDVLNQKAFASELAVTKLSFYAYLQARDRYELLDSGAALGYGCGPLLVARSTLPDLSRARIAVPGMQTTALMLLQLWNPTLTNITPVRFDRILPAVRDGEFDAGLIIHESRFVFQDYKCQSLVDLGEWWESQTGLPIPLGCIAIRRDADTIRHKAVVEALIRQSVEFAFSNPAASRPYVKSLARETDDSVIDRHIGLYVNEFSRSLGDIGWKAVRKLEFLTSNSHYGHGRCQRPAKAGTPTPECDVIQPVGVPPSGGLRP